MRHPNDDMLDGALRTAAARLRNQEIARADPDEAWARFVTEHADDAVPVRFAGPGPRRAWLSVAAIGLAAATVLVVVWIQSGPAPQQPVDSPAPAVTAVTSTTPAPAVDAAPVIKLPTFPDNKAIASLSAVSDWEWFALSDVGPSERESYPKLWHTTDAGATWVDLQPSDAVTGGPWVHFADPLNGWLLSNSSPIVATHDGGETWKQIDAVILRGGEFAAPPAISTYRGRVYVLADVDIDGNSRIGVMSSPVDSDDFVWSGTTIGDVRYGLTPNSGQLAVNGESGWAIAYGATAPGSTVSDGVDVPPGAARLIDGEWTEWAPPCAVSLEGERPYQTIKVPQLILGVSTSGGTVAVVCSGTPTYGAPRAFVSADDGATFAETTRLPDGMTLTPQSWVLVPDDDTILVGVALDTGELAVARSDDRGTTWTVETSFGGGGRFAAATITPTGRIVVVATIEDSPSARRDVAQFRDDSGTWHAIRSA